MSFREFAGPGLVVGGLDQQGEVVMLVKKRGFLLQLVVGRRAFTSLCKRKFPATMLGTNSELVKHSHWRLL